MDNYPWLYYKRLKKSFFLLLLLKRCQILFLFNFENGFSLDKDRQGSSKDTISSEDLAQYSFLSANRYHLSLLVVCHVFQSPPFEYSHPSFRDQTGSTQVQLTYLLCLRVVGGNRKVSVEHAGSRCRSDLKRH